MRVSEVLRKIEPAIRAAVTGDPETIEESASWLPVFICDAMDNYGGILRRLDIPDADVWRAKHFLRELGMGKGFDVFGEYPVGSERQNARADWLLFAADIADEWGF